MKFQNSKFLSIMHMTHIDNLDSIFKHGLLAHNNPYKKRDISNIEVNNRREKRENIYGRKIHDYVPFYFNPRNAMMYKNRHEDVVVLEFSKELLFKDNVLFTDKNAATRSAHFYHKIDDLNKIDWGTLKSQSWIDQPNAQYVKQTMMAEVLVYKSVSIKYLRKIHCKNLTTRQLLMERYNLKSQDVVVTSSMFFYF